MWLVCISNCQTWQSLHNPFGQHRIICWWIQLWLPPKEIVKVGLELVLKALAAEATTKSPGGPSHIFTTLWLKGTLYRSSLAGILRRMIYKNYSYRDNVFWAISLSYGVFIWTVVFVQNEKGPSDLWGLIIVKITFTVLIHSNNNFGGVRIKISYQLECTRWQICHTNDFNKKSCFICSKFWCLKVALQVRTYQII